MTTPDSDRMYLHFQWTMPGGIPEGPVKPLVFSIIATEMLLKDAPQFVEGLKGVIDERNLSILTQATRNLLGNPKHGPQQQHVFAFIGAPTKDAAILQAGTRILFKALERRWAGKTISLIPVAWKLFQKIQDVTNQGGFWPTPPPSDN